MIRKLLAALLIFSTAAVAQSGDYIRDTDGWHRKVADLIDKGSSLWCGTATGASNLYTLSPSIKVDSYRDGHKFIFVADKTNTGAAAASVSARGALSVVKPGSVALVAGDIVSGEYYTITYSSALNKFVLISSSQNASIAPIVALGNGLIAKTGTSTYAVRAIQTPAAGITGSNLDGVSGNPALTLANDLSALEAMSGTGLVARTGSETYAQRTLQSASAGLTWTDGDGVGGNPTPVFANDLGALEGLSSTGFAARTGTDTWATRTLTGTANQISITNTTGGGNPVFSTPQNIHTGAKPTFAGMILTSNLDNANNTHIRFKTTGGVDTNVLNLNSSNNVVLNSPGILTLQGTGGNYLTTTSTSEWSGPVSSGGWTPVISSPSGTISNTAVSYSRYFKFGKFVFVSVNWNAQLSTSAAAYISFTLPFQAEAIGASQCNHGTLAVSGTGEDGHVYVISGSVEGRAYRGTFANWPTTASSNHFLFANFWYLAAS